MTFEDEFEYMTDLQDGFVVEVKAARTSLQCTEGQTSSSQRRDVAELTSTDSLVLFQDHTTSWQVIGQLTRRTGGETNICSNYTQH